MKTFLYSTAVLAGTSLYTAFSCAALVQYDLNWQGANGYSATGYFTYDDSLDLGDILSDQELSNFSFTLFTPTDQALETYTLANQSPNLFNLFFDLNTKEILNTYNPNHPEHSLEFFQVGEWQGGSPTTGLIITNPNGYLFSGNIGCGASYPITAQPGFEVVFDNGFCDDGYVLDYDQGGYESLVVTLNVASTVVPIPAAVWLFGSALVALITRKAFS